MKLAKKIFPLNRSLTGKGTLDTLRYFKTINNKIIIKNVKSGKRIFDWEIPKEWNVNHAYFEDDEKKKYCNFKKNNLHLVGYSIKKNAYYLLINYLKIYMLIKINQIQFHM